MQPISAIKDNQMTTEISAVHIQNTLSERIYNFCLEILNTLRILGVICCQALGFSDYEIVQLDLENLSPDMQAKLKAFENSA